MTIIYAIIVLGCIALIGAVALNFVAKKFYVYEDPRIAEVESLLPGANCGGCGRNGCHDFAVASVEAGNLEGLFCPSAGEEGMKRVADYLGCDAAGKAPEIAVVKCAGTAETKTRLNAEYVGPRTCSIMSMTAGDYECQQSCLGCGDCTTVCQFDAIHILPGDDTPTVDPDKCTGCGACVKACPKLIIELRPKGLRDRRVWVACSNCMKGALAKKQCTVACIGCGICARTCPFEAITVTNNLAWIDPAKCKTCGKCIPVCPTHAIHSVNVPVRPAEPKKPVEPKKIEA